MHRFRVWAPLPRRVDVVADGRRTAMHPAGGGWWEADDAQTRPGTRYGFSLDGGDVRPDPRSAFQPDGALGLSQIVDHAAFRWTDEGRRGQPLPGSLIYELHVGTFSPAGTFAGVVEKLSHLVELGVNTIELMPVVEFSGDHGWGYDGVDLFAPHHAYGGPDQLKSLVDACHAAGLAVVLDVVYNHLGPVGNFLAEFAPYFSPTRHTLWGDAPNFDGPESDEVRRFVVDNALMWLRDYHFNGLRLDAVNAIFDESPVHILEQLAAEVERLTAQTHRSAFVIAESDLNDPRLVRSRDAGGYGLDGVWVDDWHHAIHVAMTGERSGYYEDFDSLEKTGKALRNAWVFDGEWSEHFRRTLGRKALGIAPHSFVVSLQNHDQVGNRAEGERLCSLVTAGRAKAAAALLMTSPFTPLLFQGEEWASSSPFQYFTDHHDPEVARLVSEGRRKEFESFGWSSRVPDPQDPATFERSRLSWQEVDQPSHGDMLEWYRALIALRRRLPPPPGSAGEGVEVMVDEPRRRLSFARGRVRVCVNLGDDDWKVDIAIGEAVLMASERSIQGEDGSVCVPPSSVAVLETAVV